MDEGQRREGVVDDIMEGISTASGEPNEIYSYQAPWIVYSLGFSHNPRHPYRLACGSFLEDPRNYVHIVQLNPHTNCFEVKAEFEHLYPPSKIMWVPDSEGKLPDLLATSGDSLMIWENNGQSVNLRAKLVNDRHREYCEPLTSFDWNTIDPNVIGTASIDTSCTIWDLETQQLRTQLIAHDKEVYDIAWDKNQFVFATVGADGSVRKFDLRNLSKSTIVYESPDYNPLLRIAWNKTNSNYLATIQMDSSSVHILDVRGAQMPVAELNGHTNCVNSLSWAPNSCYHICTAGDDCQALIWDLQTSAHPIEDPILAYSAEAEITMLQWSVNQPNWVAIAFNKTLQLLRV